MNWRPELAAIFVSVALAAATFAAETPPMFTITVNVDVVKTPCVINDNQMITVNFGDELYRTMIDGEHYKMLIPYTLDCANASSADLKYMIDAAPASFGNNDVIQTNIPDLGVSVLENDQPVALSTWKNFSATQQPELYAVLEKKTDVTLGTGKFTAVATLLIAYQ